MLFISREIFILVYCVAARLGKKSFGPSLSGYCDKVFYVVETHKNELTQLAFSLQLYRTVIGRAGTLLDRLQSDRFNTYIIAPDKRGYPHIIFLICAGKYMLWVLIRSASARRF